VAGLVVQVGFKEAGKDSVQFAEEWGQLLNLSVFFLFGVLVARAGHRFTVAHLLYAILSLTLVRMLPVAIALLGARLPKATVLFMGWFGPRGLASIVLGLVYVEHKMPLPGESTISLAVMATVSLSVFAHGLSAVPGISLYAKHVAALDASAPEQQGAEVKLAGEDTRDSSYKLLTIHEGIVLSMVLPRKYDCGVGDEGHVQSTGFPTVGDLHTVS
jgi:NhaP-type Na+/H+ or K+/H+ antiporter